MNIPPNPFRPGSPLLKLAKLPDVHGTGARENIRRHLAFVEVQLGMRILPGMRVLDLGCTLGHSVGALLDLGYDAYGADIYEYWDRDFETYWAIAEKPPAAVAARLRLIEDEPYRLPFDDGMFDFCISDQVMEHVLDRPALFGELRRVLKPGAISVHRFPGPGRLMEGHINVPFPPLCHSPAYLKLAALMGCRTALQSNMTWREVYDANVELMKYCDYPVKPRLRREAAAAGMQIAFVEADEMQFRSGGRFAKLLAPAKALGLARPALSLLQPLLQRYMVLRREA